MSTVIAKQSDQYLYQQVVKLIKDMQQQGTLQAGQKLPSLRALATKLNISVPTVKQAYEELEQLGLVHAKEKSGYFLKAQRATEQPPKRVALAKAPVAVNKQGLIEQVSNAVHQMGVVPLGIANPVATASTDKALARTLKRVVGLAGNHAIEYGPMDGYEPLKRQIAQRYLDYGIGVDLDELIITNGAQEGLTIALKAATQVGDVVAIESPCYFGIIELIESLGLKAYEIPLCPDEGIWLDDLGKALEKEDIKACVFSSSLNNPLGSLMPERNRQQLVSMLEAKDVVLIEDDVYGDLHFSDARPTPAQRYSQKGLVMTVSSFSKTVAPSYRVGWLLAPKFAANARRFKRAMSCSAPLLNQWTLAEFMTSGEYDRSIKRLRNHLQTNKERMLWLVRQHFPTGTRVSDPQGGCVLWVELPTGYDAVALFYEALAAQISISPGTIFSATDKFKRCFRLSYGVQWSEGVEHAVRTLAELVKQQK